MLAQLQDWFDRMTWSDLAGLVFLIQLSIYGAIWLWRTVRSWQIRWRHERLKQLQQRRAYRLQRQWIRAKLMPRNEDWHRPEGETRWHSFRGRLRHRSSWRADPWLAIGRVRCGRRREHAAWRGDRPVRFLEIRF